MIIKQFENGPSVPETAFEEAKEEKAATEGFWDELLRRKQQESEKAIVKKEESVAQPAMEVSPLVREVEAPNVIVEAF